MAADRDTESQFGLRAGICLASHVGSWWDIAPSHGLSGIFAPLTGHLSGERRVESVSSRAIVVVRGPSPGIYSDEEMPSSVIVSTSGFAM